MSTWLVYDQRIPTLNSFKEYEANLPFSGRIEAATAQEAIKVAKERRMSRWPIVEEEE